MLQYTVAAIRRRSPSPMTPAGAPTRFAPHGWLLLGSLLLLCALETGIYRAFQTAPVASPPQPWMSVKEALAYMAAQENLLVVDVRTRHEFSGSHFPGAVNMPLFQLHRLAAKLPADRPVLLTDFAGVRATHAYKILRCVRPDIVNLHYVKGGLVALPVWGASRAAVSQGDTPSAKPH